MFDFNNPLHLALFSHMLQQQRPRPPAQFSYGFPQFGGGMMGLPPGYNQGGGGATVAQPMPPIQQPAWGRPLGQPQPTGPLNAVGDYNSVGRMNRLNFGRGLQFNNY